MCQDHFPSLFFSKAINAKLHLLQIPQIQRPDQGVTGLQALCSFSRCESSRCNLPAFTRSHLYRECFPQSEKQGVHVNVGVLSEAVGFGVVLEVEVIPPAGWCSLQEGMRRKCRKEEEPSALTPPSPAAPCICFLLNLSVVLTAEQPRQGLAVPLSTECPPSDGRSQTCAPSGSIWKCGKLKDVQNHAGASRPGPGITQKNKPHSSAAGEQEEAGTGLSLHRLPRSSLHALANASISTANPVQTLIFYSTPLRPRLCLMTFSPRSLFS